MALVTYNGVSLPYSSMTDFKQEAMYDDVGRTDFYLTKFDVTVQCVINIEYTKQMFGAASEILPTDFGGVANAASVMSIIRSGLLEPRKILSIVFNGVELIPRIVNNSGLVDCANGPMPQHCNIIQLTNELFIVNYRIIAHYWENNDISYDRDPAALNQPSNPVLYNRWVDQIEIDNCKYSRRARQGKFVIRSDNQLGQTVDLFRKQMAVLGVPPGFLRETANYKVSPDGLGLEYSIVDREVYKMPPEPAYQAEGEYLESITNKGAARWGQCRVKLWGAKDTPQMKLIDAAIFIVSAKLQIVGALTDGTAREGDQRFAFLERFDVMVDMYQNIVECIMRAQLQVNTTRNGRGRVYGIAGLDFSRNMATTPIPLTSARNYQPSYTSYGTGNLLLQAANYYDPSILNTIIDQQNGNLNRGLAPGQAGKKREE